MRFLVLVWSVYGSAWLVPAQNALAADCSVSTQPLVFGAYQSLALAPLDSTTDVTVTCTRTASGAEKFNYTLGLSVGSGSYSARELQSGANKLLYNLYTSAALTTVWGDGGSASLVSGQFHLKPSEPQTQSNVHTVYGRVFGNQPTVPPGFYAAPVPITAILTY